MTQSGHDHNEARLGYSKVIPADRGQTMRKLLIALGVCAAVTVCSLSAALADYEDGVSAYRRGFYATALKEFRVLAKQGDASAQFKLGLMYGKGQGVTQNLKEAVAWYRKAAKQGKVEAQNNLGLMYEFGLGVTKDYKEAIKLYRKAAEQGLSSAQYDLGAMYAKGHGVTQDYVQSYMWFYIAAANGFVKARKNRGIVERLINASDISKAQKLAKEWMGPAAKCQKPQVTSKMIFEREKVSYDLERQSDYRSKGRPLGWYYTPDRFVYRAKISGDCLKSLDITVKVFPVIQLRGMYKKKSGKCAGKRILDHERRHNDVAKRQYKKLAADIKKLAAKLFTGKSAPDFNTVSTALNAELDKGVYKRFLKKHTAAQDRFHVDLLQRKIIKRKCRLVKGKR